MAMVRGFIVGSPSSRAAECLRELAGHIAQLVVEHLVDPTGDRFGYAPEKRMGDAPRHAGQRVAVPTQRDRLPHGILEVVRLQERPDRLRHRLLARDLKLVRGADLIQRSVEVVPECPST